MCSSDLDMVLEEHGHVRSMDKFYANVHITVKEDAVCHAIGRGGRHFDRICKLSGADQIVYNKSRGIVHVYGAPDTLDAATDMLRSHLKKVAREFGGSDRADEDVVDEKELFCVKDVDQAHMRHLIGKKGRHFKHLTRTSGTSFVWYDTEESAVAIYGSKRGIAIAKKELARLKSYAMTKLIPKYETTL